MERYDLCQMRVGDEEHWIVANIFGLVECGPGDRSGWMKSGMSS